MTEQELDKFLEDLFLMHFDPDLVEYNQELFDHYSHFLSALERLVKAGIVTPQFVATTFETFAKLVDLKVVEPKQNPSRDDIFAALGDITKPKEN